MYLKNRHFLIRVYNCLCLYSQQLYHKKTLKGIGLQWEFGSKLGEESVRLAINAFVEIVQIPDENRNGAAAWRAQNARTLPMHCYQ